QSVGCRKMGLAGGAADHQGAQLEEAWIESSNARNPGDPFRAKPFENILIDEEEWLDCPHPSVVVDDHEIAVLEVALKRIVQDLVVPVILSLVGECRHPGRASGQFGARYDGNRERFSGWAGSALTGSPHHSALQASAGNHSPAGVNCSGPLWFLRTLR